MSACFKPIKMHISGQWFVSSVPINMSRLCSLFITHYTRPSSCRNVRLKWLDPEKCLHLIQSFHQVNYFVVEIYVLSIGLVWRLLNVLNLLLHNCPAYDFRLIPCMYRHVNANSIRSSKLVITLGFHNHVTFKRCLNISSYTIFKQCLKLVHCEWTCGIWDHWIV